jgi:hypothetical protein
MASLSLRCSEPKCSYSGSFKTSWELRRHTLNQHPSSRQTLQCCAIGCSIASQHAKFTRPDKLTSHIRALHRNRSLFWCPHQDCGQRSLKGLDMFVHIQSHGSFCDPESGPLLKAVANAVSPAFPPCEVCRRSVPLHKLIEHLHDDHESDTSDWNAHVRALLGDGSDHDRLIVRQRVHVHLRFVSHVQGSTGNARRFRVPSR